MPAEPGAETGMVMELPVMNAYCNSPFTSSIISTKRGSRWPMVGRASASSTRGETSEGPGPMSVRRGGLKGDTVAAMIVPLLDLTE